MLVEKEDKRQVSFLSAGRKAGGNFSKGEAAETRNIDNLFILSSRLVFYKKHKAHLTALCGFKWRCFKYDLSKQQI